MAESLFPVFPVPSALAENTISQQTQRKYNPAPMWDFDKGDFVTNGARQPLYGTGYDAWVLWCTKTILTERGAFYGYSNNVGIEAEDAFRQPDRKAQESAFIRTITEALLADPMGRTQQVRDFGFDWKVDNLGITCTIIGAEGNTAIINADIRI